jgi:hypothetical protein
MAAGAVGDEASFARRIELSLGHDGAGGIAGAEKQHVEGFLFMRFLPPLAASPLLPIYAGRMS